MSSFPNGVSEDRLFSGQTQPSERLAMDGITNLKMEAEVASWMQSTTNPQKINRWLVHNPTAFHQTELTS